MPILPPFAAFMCLMFAVEMWRLTKRRLRFLQSPLDKLWIRLPVFVAAVGISLRVVNDAGNALKEAGSGTLFTPVEGLAKTFPFDASRNPMYSTLLLVAMPAFAALLDSAWPFLMIPLLYGRAPRNRGLLLADKG